MNEYDILVNKDNRLDKSYIPKDLVHINGKIKPYIDSNYEMLLVEIVLLYFTKLKLEALKHGFDLEISSGYRSYEYQEKIYNYYLKTLSKGKAAAYSAIPGCSEHQTGLALDFLLYRERKRIEMTEEEIQKHEELSIEATNWVHKNSHNYGFIVRYPKPPIGCSVHPITGFAYEPWHLRYVGDVADEIYNDGNSLVLEEYKFLTKKKLHK